MIQLICTHCRAMLEMDDGFAGGACRCRHCGTIQTVPSNLKTKTGAARPARTLYQARPDNAVPSSGLDQLADVVASSGLNSSRLRRAATPVAPETKPAASRNIQFLLIVAGALIVILCTALIYLVTRDSPRGGAIAPHPEAPASALPARPAPNFCGIPLTGDTVIYILDRGDSTRDHFDALKSATLKSLNTLGEKKQFQILFWSNGGKEAGFPQNWPIFATRENIAAADRAFDDITPHGKTDIKIPLKNAIAANPSEIVIVTGKAWDLDDAFVKSVDQIRKQNQVKIDTVSIGDPGGSTALQTIAGQTHGTFKTVTDADLK